MEKIQEEETFSRNEMQGVITCMEVFGDKGLSIQDVNPLRSNYIYNFDYFKRTNWMYQEIINAIDAWENAVDLAWATGDVVRFEDYFTEGQLKYLKNYVIIGDVFVNKLFTSDVPENEIKNQEIGLYHSAVRFLSKWARPMID